MSGFVCVVGTTQSSRDHCGSSGALCRAYMYFVPAKNLAMSSVITVSGEMLKKTLAEQATVVIQKNREALRMHKAKIAQATALLAMSLDPSTTFDITETSVKVHMTTSSTDSTDSSTDNSDSSKNTQALWRGCISTWPYSSVLSYRWGGGRVIND